MRAPVTTRPARVLVETSRSFWVPLLAAAGALYGYCWAVETWF